MATQNARMLQNNEIASFCSQMAMILHAGISVLEGVEMMAEDVDTNQGKAILQEINQSLEQTGSLAQALKACRVFPQYAVDMVDIGEQSGKLEEVMRSLSSYYEREESIAQGIKSAVTYPFVMIGMMLVVILVLVVQVLPMFNQVFEQLGGDLNGFSQGVLNVGQAISRYSVVLIVLFVLCIVVYLILTKTRFGRRALRQLGSKAIFSRRLYHQIAAGRFASGMALMLSSGMDPEQGLEMVKRLVDNPVFAQKISECQRRVSEGEEFSKALVSAGIFTGVYARMVAIGYKTGAVDETLQKIAQQYEEEVDERIGQIVSRLEPTLVAVLSVIVGLILLSVMLPLMGIMSSIG